MMDIVFSSTTQLAAAIRAGHVSATEVLEAHLAQIATHNSALNAIITMDAERAYERAHKADKALASGEVWGYAFKVVSSDAFAREKLQTMRAFGADLIILPSQGGQTTPDLIPRMVEAARELAAEEGTYWTNQLHNADVLKGYEPLGRELLEQIETPIHAFCGAVGTAGILMGVARALRQANSRARIVALEPASSAIISTGKAGTHDVEGIGIGMVPPHLDNASYDEVRGIDLYIASLSTSQTPGYSQETPHLHIFYIPAIDSHHTLCYHETSSDG